MKEGRKYPSGDDLKQLAEKIKLHKAKEVIVVSKEDPLAVPFIVNVTEDIDAAAERLRKILDENREANKVFFIGCDLAQKRINNEIQLDVWSVNHNGQFSLLNKEDESESILKDIKKEGFELLNKVFLNKEGAGDSQPLMICDIESLANEIYSNELNSKDDLPTMLKEWEENPNKQWNIRNETPFLDGGFTLENLPTYNLPFESDYEVDEAHKMRMLNRIHELNEEAKKEIARIKASTSVDFLTDSDDLYKTHNE